MFPSQNDSRRSNFYKHLVFELKEVSEFENQHQKKKIAKDGKRIQLSKELERRQKRGGEKKMNE